jgi:hypothetical protein
VLTTIASSVSIGDNLARSQATTPTDPTVSQGTTYYPADIGKVTSIDDIVNNYQLFSYPMKACGLGDTTCAKGASITREGDSKRRADTTNDPCCNALATAFGFTGKRAAKVVDVTAVTTDGLNTSLRRQAEDDDGPSLIKVFDWLYTSRKSPLADDDFVIARQPTSFEVRLDPMRSPQARSPADIDVPANMIQTFPTPTSLRDTTKVEMPDERLVVFWDPSNPPTGAAVASVRGSSDTSLCRGLFIQSLRIGGV